MPGDKQYGYQLKVKRVKADIRHSKPPIFIDYPHWLMPWYCDCLLNSRILDRLQAQAWRVFDRVFRLMTFRDFSVDLAYHEQ